MIPEKSYPSVPPSTWHKAPLGDIYTERKEPGNATLPVLSVSIHSGVSDGELDEENLGKKVKRIEDRTQYRTAHAGDLVFNMMRAWQGAIGTAPSDELVSPAYIVAKPSDAVYPPFMDYFMKTPRMIHTINRQSYGVTDFRKRLYWDSFAPIACVLPSLPEQRKIAAILTAQDKVIELKEKLLAEKQRQKKHLMQQLLTGKKRLPGFSGKKATYTFDEVFRVIPAKRHQILTTEYEQQGKYPVVDQSKAYVAGYSNTCEKLFKCPPNGIIVFGDHTREVKYVDFDFVVGADGTQLLTVANDAFCTQFLYQYLKNQRINNDGYARHFKYVKAMLFDIPSLGEQSAISAILSTADREIALLQESITAEKAKKKALMQLLLTGIVRV